MRTRSSLAALIATALTACGGGGGGSGPVTTPHTLPPVASASASGRVVDTADGTPLAGIAVGLAPFTAGASPIVTAATGADGSFALAAPAGRYLLVIGSDSPSDARATFHLPVTLAAGSNALAAPVPQPFPGVQYSSAQLSGAFRLAALSGDETSCVGGANAGRTGLGLRALIPDELLLEDARAVRQEEADQSTDTPTPLFANPPDAQYVFAGMSAPMHTEQDFPTCGNWTGPAYSYLPNKPPYAQASNPAEIWFGAAFATAPAGDPHASYGAELWQTDPRS